MTNKDQLELEILRVKLKQANYELGRTMTYMRPSMTYPVSVFLDGTRWVCLLDTHNDRMKCPQATGESPDQACDNFDHLWMGSAEFLVDQEEEEEQF